MNDEKRIKYPRTPHLAWSLGMTEDDKRIKSMDGICGKRVIVTEKMDGENTTLYHDYFHARSIDSRMHPSRNWLAAFHAQIQHEIPAGWRVCGENVYAKHSVAYDSLPSYFMGFSIWNEKNECLAWDETQQWFELMGITSVPVLYDGEYNEQAIKKLHGPQDDEKREGYVVRIADAFAYENFPKSVAKFVRLGHVQTDKHWAHSEIIPNQLQKRGIKP